MVDEHARRRLAAVSRRLAAEGLVSGAGGNVSLRTPQGILITPSGLPCAETGPDDLVLVDLEGRVLEGTRKPSSETPMHLAVYRHHPQVGGIVHTHSLYASAFATAGREIPPYHYMVAAVGDRVPLAPTPPSAPTPWRRASFGPWAAGMGRLFSNGTACWLSGRRLRRPWIGRWRWNTWRT